MTIVVVDASAHHSEAKCRDRRKGTNLDSIVSPWLVKARKLTPHLRFSLPRRAFGHEYMFHYKRPSIHFVTPIIVRRCMGIGPKILNVIVYLAFLFHKVVQL